MIVHAWTALTVTYRKCNKNGFTAEAGRISQLIYFQPFNLSWYLFFLADQTPNQSNVDTCTTSAASLRAILIPKDPGGKVGMYLALNVLSYCTSQLFSLYSLPFSSRGEPYDHVICVWYKLLNKHLLIISLAKRTWEGENKERYVNCQLIMIGLTAWIKKQNVSGYTLTSEDRVPFVARNVSARSPIPAIYLCQDNNTNFWIFSSRERLRQPWKCCS